MTTFSVATLDASGFANADVEALLQRCFVDGGFTDRQVAAIAFTAENIRARGTVLVAVSASKALLGMVVAVPPGSLARRFLDRGSSEMHLLCVEPDHRERGVGSALVEACIEQARRDGATRLVLWTQPAMKAAQRLYARHGFARESALDFPRGRRRYLVYALAISAAGAA